jgi:hypothetical protein
MAAFFVLSYLPLATDVCINKHFPQQLYFSAYTGFPVSKPGAYIYSSYTLISKPIPERCKTQGQNIKRETCFEEMLPLFTDFPCKSCINTNFVIVSMSVSVFCRIRHW